MGLSVVPKNDFTTYGNGRLGRPGYDYAAATRRSGLFDGYTGFAIYSSISQGLDEITYGGRRSRRNSITENSFGTSGTTLSRRGSFANISDYSAMLAASAAVEAATKTKEEDTKCTKNEKEEKKKDMLDLSAHTTYNNSSKISRQSSVAEDSAFSESSPGLTSKRNHQYQQINQISKANVGMDYNKDCNRNDKEVGKDTKTTQKEKQDAHRTLSPSSLEIRPISILSRQESQCDSRSATKIERQVSFNEGPIESPTQRPVSTMDKDGKREKRKHKDKDKETDKEKEARRAERRKRRELKELKKKEKEKELEAIQGDENCGALLIEVSQKLLALEKEQQVQNDESEGKKQSPKSQLEVIPPSSLLSGINDERPSQLQILQKQKLQQQEHQREQQRLEQERIDEQKMLHQQQKWLLQNQATLNQTVEINQEATKNDLSTPSLNAINNTNSGSMVENTFSSSYRNNITSEQVDYSKSNIENTNVIDKKDEEIKRLDNTIVAKQIAQDEIEDSGNGSDPSAASSPSTTTKKDHLLVGSMVDANGDEESLVLREKELGKALNERNASKRNSLDGKTVQGLAQDLAAECAKAYALMENSLSKFSNDFGPFGITPRNRVGSNK